MTLRQYYLDEDHVEFVEIGLFFLEGLGAGACLDDEADDVLLDALALVTGQNFPPGLDHTLKNLEGVILCLLVVGKLQYGVNLNEKHKQLSLHLIFE